MAGLYDDTQNWRTPTTLAPTKEQVAERRKAQDDYAKQNPGPFSAAANRRYEDLSGQEQAVHPSGVDLQNQADGASIPQEQKRGVLEATPAQQEQAATVPVGDSTVNPGHTVAAVTTNRRNGVGNQDGGNKLTPLPTLEEVTNDATVAEGKQVMFRDIVTPNWYEDDSFYEGMLSFGLNMLAGNDIASSFNAGASVFQNSKALEKRQIWAQDLLAQGYDAHEVEAWIRTGDNKALTDPFEKKARAQAFELGQQQLISARRENDPATLRNKAKLDEYDRIARQEDREFNRSIQLGNLAINQAQSARAAEKHAEEMKALRTGRTGKYDEQLSKAKAFDARARSGLQNYDAVASKYEGKDIYSGKATGWKSFIPGSDMATRLADAKTVELALSGDPLKIQMAREVDPDITDMVLAEKEWLTPIMRKDSGAAVSHSEWNNMGNIYFPRPGDSSQVIEQKRQARTIATLAADPGASYELKQAVEMVNQGALQGIKMVGGQVFVSDGRQWYNVNQR